MKDALERATRTFVFAFITTLLSSGLFSTMAIKGVVAWSDLEKLAISATLSGLIALFTFVINALENNTSFPALLKPAPPAVNPVPDDAVAPKKRTPRKPRS